MCAGSKHARLSQARLTMRPAPIMAHHILWMRSDAMPTSTTARMPSAIQFLAGPSQPRSDISTWNTSCGRATARGGRGG